jgi:hypothetical protein
LDHRAVLDYRLIVADLEDLLLQHPDIDDAAVVGVYDAQQATEVPRAYGKYHRLLGMTHIERRCHQLFSLPARKEKSL